AVDGDDVRAVVTQEHAEVVEVVLELAVDRAVVRRDEPDAAAVRALGERLHGGACSRARDTGVTIANEGGRHGGGAAMTTVIDADQHLFEARELWAERSPARDRDDCVRIVDDDLGFGWVTWRGRRIYPAEVFRPGDVDGTGAGRAANRAGERADVNYDDAPADYHDPDARIARLDALGLDAAVLFPNAGLVWERAVERDLHALTTNMAVCASRCSVPRSSTGSRCTIPISIARGRRSSSAGSRPSSTSRTSTGRSRSRGTRVTSTRSTRCCRPRSSGSRPRSRSPTSRSTVCLPAIPICASG